VGKNLHHDCQPTHAPDNDDVVLKSIHMMTWQKVPFGQKAIVRAVTACLCPTIRENLEVRAEHEKKHELPHMLLDA
jgi:hypothetical protein